VRTRRTPLPSQRFARVAVHEDRNEPADASVSIAVENIAYDSADLVDRRGHIGELLVQGVGKGFDFVFLGDLSHMIDYRDITGRTTGSDGPTRGETPAAVVTKW
jgi:hypothetical protein